MIKEECGQISLEYILIFTISLIILMIFTLPLAENSIKDTLDVYDSLNVKSDLSKISCAINQGSKQTVKLESKNNLNVNVQNNYISTSFKLKNNSKKDIKEYVVSNIKKSSLHLTKGENVIVVEWPINCENMLIYQV